MFAFTLITGFLICIAWRLGLGLYIIIIFGLATIAGELEKYLKNKEYEEAVEKVKITLKQHEDAKEAQKEKAKQAADNISTDAFFNKNEVPVRIDKETGAYIVNIEELLSGIDNYYKTEISKFSKEELDEMFKEEDKHVNK